MNNKTKIYVLVLIWAAALVQIFINNGIEKENDLVAAISIYEDAEYESEISSYGYYSDEKIDEATKSIIVKKIAAQLGIDTGYEVRNENTMKGRTTTLEKLGRDGDTLIQLVTIENTLKKDNGEETGLGEAGSSDEDDCYENYLLINIKLHDKINFTNEERKKVKDIMASIGIEPVINMYVSGKVSGKITEQEMEEDIAKFMEMMNAAEVTRETFGEVTTIYGYTREISDYVYQNEDKVNVNIAFSYDVNENTTKVHMAVPFVNKSY